MATASPTYAREDLTFDIDELISPPTCGLVRTSEWPQKLVAGALASTLVLAPFTVGCTTYDLDQIEQRPTPASLHGAQQTAAQVAAPPRKISLVEAMRLAEANYRHVESLLEREVERDAQGTAVWEEE